MFLARGLESLGCPPRVALPCRRHELFKPLKPALPADKSESFMFVRLLRSVESHRQPASPARYDAVCIPSLGVSIVQTVHVHRLPRMFTCMLTLRTGESSLRLPFLCIVVRLLCTPPGCPDAEKDQIDMAYRRVRQRHYCCAPVGIAEMLLCSARH